MNTIKYISSICVSFFFFFPALAASGNPQNTPETATFAGGCFWTMQRDFDAVPGVIKTTAGYTGGNLPNPTYEQVESGDTGHYESVQIIFNPAQVSYSQLLDVYWHNIDPTNANGQFCDSGSQYRPVIFYNNATQQKLASESKQQLLNSKRFTSVVTQILPAVIFYPAEEYHQEFSRKNPERYNLYRTGCGRDERLLELWK